MGQVFTQAPLTHSWLPAQRKPQPPQFDGSNLQSTQTPEQNSESGAHTVWHEPLMHAKPGDAQKLPQLPQL